MQMMMTIQAEPLKDSRRTASVFRAQWPTWSRESALHARPRMLDGQPGHGKQDEGSKTKIKLTKDKCGSKQSKQESKKEKKQKGKQGAA